MSDKSNEKISNLMDGELEVQASKFLLKRLASDSDLSDTWNRYHIIRSCMQKDREAPLSIDISDKVMQSLRDKEIQIETPESTWKRMIRPVLGAGIAATVAFMSLMVVQNRQNQPVQGVIEPNVIVNATNQPSIDVDVPSAQLVGASRTVPSYLSRYPSMSAKESSIYNQSVGENIANRPYIYIINHSQNANSQQPAPLKSKDIAE